MNSPLVMGPRSSVSAPSEKEQRLRSKLFGTKEEERKIEHVVKNEISEDDFVLDPHPDRSVLLSSVEATHGKPITATAVWEDGDEAGARSLYQTLHPTPSWVAAATESPISAGQFSSKPAGGEIAPDLLDISRLRDANASRPSHTRIQSVRFHPSGSVLAIGGRDRRLSLVRIQQQQEATPHELIGSLFLEDLPLRSISFLLDGHEILCFGERSHFYLYDLERCHLERISYLRGRKEKVWQACAVAQRAPIAALLGERSSEVVLLDTHSRQCSGVLRANCKGLSSASISPDGRYVYATGDGRCIWEWDTVAMRCLRVIPDDGGVRGTAVASSDSHLACASDSGIVNVYPRDDRLGGEKRTFENITTAIGCMSISPDEQLIAFASAVQRDQLKVAHLATGRVYANWPCSSTPLGLVTALDWSTHNGYLAIGNERGSVLLYQLNHYRNILSKRE